MSDEMTPDEARALADSIMGHHTRSEEEAISAAAEAHVDDKPGPLQRYDTGWPEREEDEAEELTSGAPDTAPPHNPWSRD